MKFLIQCKTFCRFSMLRTSQENVDNEVELGNFIAFILFFCKSSIQVFNSLARNIIIHVIQLKILFQFVLRTKRSCIERDAISDSDERPFNSQQNEVIIEQSKLYWKRCWYVIGMNDLLLISRMKLSLNSHITLVAVLFMEILNVFKNSQLCGFYYNCLCSSRSRVLPEAHLLLWFCSLTRVFTSLLVLASHTYVQWSFHNWFQYPSKDHKVNVFLYVISTKFSFISMQFRTFDWVACSKCRFTLEFEYLFGWRCACNQETRRHNHVNVVFQLLDQHERERRRKRTKTSVSASLC